MLFIYLFYSYLKTLRLLPSDRFDFTFLMFEIVMKMLEVHCFVISHLSNEGLYFIGQKRMTAFSWRKIIDCMPADREAAIVRTYSHCTYHGCKNVGKKIKKR